MSQKYINPKATDQQILRVSHAMVCIFLFGFVYEIVAESSRLCALRLLWVSSDSSSSILASQWGGFTCVYLVIRVRLLLINGQTFMGVILGSAVVPIACAITWKKVRISHFGSVILAEQLLLSGQQVGMHRRSHLWILHGSHCVAGNHRHSQRRRYQCYGKNLAFAVKPLITYVMFLDKWR